MGDLNASLDNAVLKDFYNLHNLKGLTKKATFYKSLINPSFTDLLLTNSRIYVQNSSVIGVMKMSFRKTETKIINYRNYGKFL